MRTIRIRRPEVTNLDGIAVCVPVVVDWFPPLTESQIIENAAALVMGQPEPHPDPNLISIELTH